MKVSTVRDLLGEPTSWGNHISDGTDDMPPMDGATILDVFSSGRQLSIYTRSLAGAEALSLFLIENSALCARIAEALKPGLDIHKALATPID